MFAIVGGEPIDLGEPFIITLLWLELFQLLFFNLLMSVGGQEGKRGVKTLFAAKFNTIIRLLFRHT